MSASTGNSVPYAIMDSHHVNGNLAPRVSPAFCQGLAAGRNSGMEFL